MPASPSTSPATVPRWGRSRRSRCHSSSTIQQGVIATSSAATPDGIRRTAHETSPFDEISAAPTIAAASHCSFVSSRDPSRSPIPSRIAPARRYRAPAIGNGGSDATANFMNR